MTELLYFDDCYRKEMEATVEESGEGWVVLDRTVFYPTGGGQENDTGILVTDGGEFRVRDVRKDHGRVKHFLEEDVEIEGGSEVRGKIDWDRRYENMRMHTAQHLVSAVVLKEFGASTVGNQVYPDKSRIDFNPADFSREDIELIEERTNQLISENLTVSIYQLDREEAIERADPERANLDLLPDDIEKLRMVEIEDYDICPCGGTHVAGLDELDRVEILGTENKGQETVRITYTLE